MRSSIVASRAVICLLAGSFCAAQSSSSTPEVPVVESATVRLLTARVRIEPTYDNAPDCRALVTDDLKISIRGERLPDGWPVRLEREPVPALHALLVDTSGSMYGDMPFVREAAIRYVRQLPSWDRAMVITFDETVVLAHGLSADTNRLVAAIEGLRMGGTTSLHDAVFFAFRELDQHTDRPVVVLLTDGVDAGSLYERADINALAERRRDLIVFVVGLDVPQINRMRPSTKRFLQRLSGRTDGKYFEAHRAPQLSGIYGQIREALDNEAVITLTDPDPAASPQQVKISSRVRGCRVRVYRSLESERFEPAQALSVVGRTVSVAPDRVYLRYYTLGRRDALRPECASRVRPAHPRWFVELADGRLDVCALDMTMETGLLYNADSTSRQFYNGYIDLTTRPFVVPLPALARLPDAPEQLLDGLALQAIAVADDEVKTDPRQVPVEAHARPYRDMTGLIHGRVIHDLREAVARALWLDPDYRAWAREMLEEEAERRLETLRERLRRVAPGTPEATIDEAARLSPAGRAILARAEEPGDRDLAGLLFAWLGDISAHDLFLRWEGLWIDGLLAETQAAEREGFLARWNALYRLFFVPSYARTLALFAPVRDEANRRLGFWRVLLPRPSWMGNRVRGWKNREAFSDLPLDLLPDRPFGYLLLDRLRREATELFGHLRAGGFRYAGAEYSIPGPPRLQGPETAYQSTRAVLELTDGEAARLTLRWELEWKKKRGEPRLAGLSLEAAGDPRLEELSRRVALDGSTARLRLLGPGSRDLDQLEQ